MISVQNLKKKADNFEPIFILVGTDQYLKEVAIKVIKEKTLVDSADDFNFINFDMESSVVDEAIYEASMTSFLGGSKLVILHNAFFMTGKKPRSAPKHELDALENYLQNPNPDTTLVLIVNDEKMDQRKKVVKIAKQKATLVDISSPKAHEASKLAMQYIKDQGYQIDQKAFELLGQLTQQDLNQMINEINKLIVYHQEDHLIQYETVKNLVPKSLEQNVFELNDLVLNGEVSKSIKVYQEMLAQKKDPILIIAILTGEFRLLLQSKILHQKGMPQKEIAKILSVHPYRVQLALKKIQNYDQQQLSNALKFLIEADYQIKKGQVDSELVFELFVMRFSKSKVANS